MTKIDRAQMKALMDEAKASKTKKLDIPPTKFDLAEQYLSEKYDLRKNMVTEMVEWKEKGSDKPYATMENEADFFIELQKARISISQNNLSALFKSSFVKSHDPFKEYFEALRPWDAVEGDLIGRLAGYIRVSAKDRKRLDTQFRKMLVRTIACALDEKNFNKQIFVLVQSKQNTGKTTFLRWLCPDGLKDYYSENITFDDKDSNLAMTENFMINIDELATLHRAEINKLKSYISKGDDKSRRAYAVRAIRRIRRASFVASTNDLEFLTDTTGNVRWICFRIDGIDFDYTNEFEVDRIWAQAFQLYRSGFDYKLNLQEVSENEAANKNFMRVSMEVQLVNQYFIPGSKEDHEYFLNSTEILKMFNDTLSARNLSNVRIGQALGFLGFEKTKQYKKEKSYSEFGYFVKIDHEKKVSEFIKNHFESLFENKPNF